MYYNQPMEIPVKKLENGFSLPVYGSGTWHMGGGHWETDTSNDTNEIAAIKAAIEMGVTHIDTAEMYGAGHAEELVGQAIQGVDREKFTIVTKVSPSHFHYDDVLTSCHRSLRRLQIRYIDLYLLHAPNLTIPIEESLRAMDVLVGEGSVKNIGVSNFSTERMQNAQNHTKNKIVANQVHYSLLNREPETDGLLQYCQENDAMLIAYRPVEKGMLAEEGNDLIREICKKYNKTPAQIAINWLISQDSVVTIAKTSNVEHLKENLGAIGWQMEKEDIERLRMEFPDQNTISDTVPLK